MIITRLDGRSAENNRLAIKNEKGEVVAELILTSSSSATLSISTSEGMFIEKPNGWDSK